LSLPVETLKSVPRGKAVWNANGGFVSVLLTHLFVIYLFTYLFFVSFYCSYINHETYLRTLVNCTLCSEKKHLLLFFLHNS